MLVMPFARQRAHWESRTLASTQTIEQSAMPTQVDVFLRRNIRVPEVASETEYSLWNGALGC
jgi:hypothetical protein